MWYNSITKEKENINKPRDLKGTGRPPERKSPQGVLEKISDTGINQNHRQSTEQKLPKDQGKQRKHQKAGSKGRG